MIAVHGSASGFVGKGTVHKIAITETLCSYDSSTQMFSEKEYNVPSEEIPIREDSNRNMLFRR